MTVDIDVSEIIRLADDLEKIAPKQMVNAVKKVTVDYTKEVQTGAKAAAPRDRPWLSTQGIRRRTRAYSDAVVGTVFTISDPRGRPVGFFVTYGTSTTEPNDFLSEGVTPVRDRYPNAVLEAIDPLSGNPGSPESDDSDA